MSHEIAMVISSSRRVSKQRGVVLVVVLWLLVLLEILVATQVVNARTESELVRNRVDRLQARAAAEAGLFQTIDKLARQKGEKEQLLRTDGGVYSMDYNNVSVTLSVLDEAGKVDLNGARPQMLLNVFTSVAGDAEKGKQLTDAVLDWRDSDHNRRENGAEDDDYKASGKPYGAKDEYFDNLEELLLVLGMDGDLYSKLTSMLTVNTGAKGINPAVAQRAVLLAIPGVTTDQVDEYLQARERHYTQDQPMPIFPIQNQDYINKDRDQFYSLHVQAVTHSGTIERISAVTRVSAQAAEHRGLPYVILSWNAIDRSDVLPMPEKGEK